MTTKYKTKKNAIAYTRYSSRNQSETSTQAQIREIKAYCQANDINLLAIYSDEETTGTNDNRDQFQEMILATKSKNVDMVVFHKIDRFARNSYDYVVTKKLITDNKSQIVSVLEPITDTPESIMLEMLLVAQAEFYSKNLAREVRKGKKTAALEGRFSGGNAPLGYEVHPTTHKYIIDEYESKIIKLIYELYLNNFGYRLIQTELHNRGYLTKRQNSFGRNAIKDILKNEAYIGTMITTLDNSEEIRVENNHPSLIDKNDWLKVQEMIKGNRPKPRRNAKRLYLLTGYLKCNCGCNGTYAGTTTKNRIGTRYPMYISVNRQQLKNCTQKGINAVKIEKFILESIDDKILSDNAIDYIATKILEELDKDKTTSSIDALKKKESELINEIDNLINVAASTGSKRLAIQIDEKEKLLETIQQEINDLDVLEENSNFNINKIKEFLIDIRNNLVGKDIEVQRKLIETFVDKILIDNEQIEVFFRVSLTADSKGNIMCSDKVKYAPTHLTLSNTINRTILVNDY